MTGAELTAFPMVWFPQVTVHVPAGRHLVFGSPHYAIAATFSEMPAQTDPVQHTAMTALEFQTTYGNSVKVEIPPHDTIMNLVVQLNGAIIFPGYSKTDTTEPDGSVTVALSEDSHLVNITAPHISFDVKLENLWRHKRADENDRLFAHFDVDGAGPMIGFLGESMYEPIIPSPMLRAPKTVMPSQVLDDLQDLKYAIASGWCYTSVPEATQLPWGTVACGEV